MGSARIVALTHVRTDDPLVLIGLILCFLILLIWFALALWAAISHLRATLHDRYED